MQAPQAVRVDLCAVRFFDCSGLNALLEGREQASAAGIRFGVRVPAGSVAERVLQLAGAESLSSDIEPGDLMNRPDWRGV
ncbi:STAS domain-containing protein [Streptomyces sp. NPDC058307]|uniref:STAS domain-containing protein n=1 Tax=Streptomyces sp. NPDC058307 TaxID=3346439 RepID=UPI0036ECCE06